MYEKIVRETDVKKSLCERTAGKCCRRQSGEFVFFFFVLSLSRVPEY